MPPTFPWSTSAPRARCRRGSPHNWPCSMPLRSICRSCPTPPERCPPDCVLRGGFTCFGTIARARGFAIPDEADPNDGITLTYAEFVDAIDRLASVDFPLERSNEEAWLDFVGWRINYEAAAYAIARAIDAPPALWSGPRRHPIPAIPPQRPATRRAGNRRCLPPERRVPSGSRSGSGRL